MQAARSTKADAPEASGLRLGIVIPLANEETTVEALFDRIRPHLARADRVFCIFDRVCRDRTRELAEQYHARKDERFVVVWAPETRCVADAYFRGYREAYERGCRWILEMDGGFSHLPEEIPQFIAGMEAGYDYVGGSRFMRGGRHASPVTRRVVSWGGSVLSRWLLRTSMSDMTSGFECFSRPAMTEVLERGVLSRANFFQTEIRYMMSRHRWKEVPIHYSNDRMTVRRGSIREALRVLAALCRQRRNTP